MDILDLLRRNGLEPDQSFMAALSLAGGMTSKEVSDDHLFVALYRLNTLSTRTIDLDLAKLQKAYDKDAIVRETIPANLLTNERMPPEKVRLFNVGNLESIYDAAINAAGSSRTFTSRHFLLALLENALAYGDSYIDRGYAFDLLAMYYRGNVTTPISGIPEIQTLLSALREEANTPEDFQFILAMEGDQIVLRVVSQLGDYLEKTPTGVLIPQRALLTHFKDQFGGFTEDEINELQDLLNSVKAREEDFQRFFEHYTHFFRRWDYREVHPHVHLVREDGPLVPDFILTNREAQKAAIVELKLPTPRVVRRQRNRDRFAASIVEARAQLLRYRDWFRIPTNRVRLIERLGMAVYEPQLTVIVGRSSDFQDAIDRQSLAADNPDIEVVTYDDILTFANKRRLIIRPSGPCG